MNINIFGSTGTIGNKTLYILNKYFPNIKIKLGVFKKWQSFLYCAQLIGKLL